MMAAGVGTGLARRLRVLSCSGGAESEKAADTEYDDCGCVSSAAAAAAAVGGAAAETHAITTGSSDRDDIDSARDSDVADSSIEAAGSPATGSLTNTVLIAETPGRMVPITAMLLSLFGNGN